MITFLTGDNSFEIDRALREIVAGFDGTVERIDGSELKLAQLPDSLMGVSLFADSRLIVIKNLSENKEIWPVIGEWLPKVADEIHLILVDPTADKRTVGYKAVMKAADVKEFANWGERDTAVAEKWVVEEAKKQGLELDKKLAQQLVRKIGVDQWQLYHSIAKLALLDEITEENVEDIIESNPSENAFNLLETAINGDTKKLRSMLSNLEQIEDPYRLFGLLSSQVFQLAAITAAGPNDNPAKDFGIHPYVVSRLKVLSKKLGKNGVTKLVQTFAGVDEQLKTSAIEPWLFLERSLITIK